MSSTSDDCLYQVDATFYFDHPDEHFFPDRGHSWNVLPIPLSDGRHSCKLLSIPGPDQMMIVQMKPVLVACFKDDD